MLAPSLALELAKTTLRRAYQQTPSFAAYPLMAMPLNLVLVPRCKPILNCRGNLTREAPANRVIVTNLPRQAQVPNLVPT